MHDIQAIADRVELTALCGAYTDAVMVRQHDRLVSLFTEDAVLRIPDAGVELVGSAAIRTGLAELATAWEFFVQNTHPGSLDLDGDTATGRAYILEFGRLTDGRSIMNHALFHDRYRRTPDGWRFTERTYEVRYFDSTPLPGSPDVVWPPK